MPAYNFKSQFAALVATGQKRQTLRPRRKHPTRPGQQLKLYTGMRTKACRLLYEAPCTQVLPVIITLTGGVILNGKELDYPATREFIKADGFYTSLEFWQFFDAHYGLPVELELIKW